MQIENAKSLSTEECAWKFSKKGTYLFPPLCLDEYDNIFMDSNIIPANKNSICQWCDKAKRSVR